MADDFPRGGFHAGCEFYEILIFFHFALDVAFWRGKIVSYLSQPDKRYVTGVSIVVFPTEPPMRILQRGNGWKRTLVRGACVTPAFLLAAALFGNGTPAPAQLIITPSYDAATLANAPLMADITSAISIYNTTFSDTMGGTPISIYFRYSATQPNGTAFPANTLGQSNYTVYTQPYATFTNALKADSKSGNDATAVANLPAAAAFPNNPTNITFSSANGRAVAFNTPGAMNTTSAVGTGGTLDGIVSLNSAMPFSRVLQNAIEPPFYLR